MSGGKSWEVALASSQDRGFGIVAAVRAHLSDECASMSKSEKPRLFSEISVMVPGGGGLQVFSRGGHRCYFSRDEAVWPCPPLFTTHPGRCALCPESSWGSKA